MEHPGNCVERCDLAAHEREYEILRQMGAAKASEAFLFQCDRSVDGNPSNAGLHGGEKAALHRVISRFLRSAQKRPLKIRDTASLADVWNVLVGMLPCGENSAQDVADQLAFLLEGLAVFFVSLKARWECCKAVDRILHSISVPACPGHRKTAAFLKWSCLLPACFSIYSRILNVLLDQEVPSHHLTRTANDSASAGEPAYDLAWIFRYTMQSLERESERSFKTEGKESSGQFDCGREFPETSGSKESYSSIFSVPRNATSPTHSKMLNLLSSHILKWTPAVGACSGAQPDGNLSCALKSAELNSLRVASRDGLCLSLVLLHGLEKYFSSFLEEYTSTPASPESKLSGREKGLSAFPEPCSDQEWTQHVLSETKLCLSLVRQEISSCEANGADMSRTTREASTSPLLFQFWPQVCRICNDLLQVSKFSCSSSMNFLDQNLTRWKASVLVASILHGTVEQLKDEPGFDAHLITPIIFSLFDERHDRVDTHTWRVLRCLATTAALENNFCVFHLAMWHYSPPKDCSNTLLDAYLSATTSILTHNKPKRQLFLEGLDRMTRLISLQFSGDSLKLSTSLFHTKLLVKSAGELIAFFIRDWMALAIKSLESSDCRAVLSGLDFVTTLLESAPKATTFYVRDLFYRIFLIYLTFVPSAPDDPHRFRSTLLRSLFETERREVEGFGWKIRQACLGCLRRLRLVAGEDVFESLLKCLGVQASLQSPTHNSQLLRQELTAFRIEAINSQVEQRHVSR